MRVLWVEDFGGDAVPENLLNVIFKGVLSPERRNALADTQNLKKRLLPKGFGAWRQWYATQPDTDEIEIDIYRYLSDFEPEFKKRHRIRIHGSVAGQGRPSA
ncbi:MAG: hypothetical protein Q8O25_02345 [Sulfurisoma sp.]|nr:hypothetical protein [Sulfurisoma sp.]